MGVVFTTGSCAAPTNFFLSPLARGIFSRGSAKNCTQLERILLSRLPFHWYLTFSFLSNTKRERGKAELSEIRGSDHEEPNYLGGDYGYLRDAESPPPGHVHSWYHEKTFDLFFPFFFFVSRRTIRNNRYRNDHIISVAILRFSSRRYTGLIPGPCLPSSLSARVLSLPLSQVLILNHGRIRSSYSDHPVSPLGGEGTISISRDTLGSSAPPTTPSGDVIETNNVFLGSQNGGDA